MIDTRIIIVIFAYDFWTRSFFFFFFLLLENWTNGKWWWSRVGRQLDGEVVKRHEEASPLSLQRLREPGADRVYTRVRNKGYNKNTNDGSIFPDDLRTFSQLVVQSLKTMFHHSHIYIYARIITYIPIKKKKANQNSVYHRIFDQKKKNNKLLRLER